MPVDTTAPGPAEGDLPSLDTLRREIDRIDDQMLDLLLARAKVVETVGAVKRARGEDVGVFLRAGREMDILRRLIRRAEGGSFPKGVIVRMWREMFSALVAIQGPMNLAVYQPARGAGYLEMARDAYGAYTATTPHTTTGAVVRAVSTGEATVGILPLPRMEEPDGWWPMLVSSAPDTPRVVARIPFCGPGPGRGEGLEGLVIARLELDRTDNDRTYIVLETDAEISRAGVRDLVEKAGFTPLELTDSVAPTPDSRPHLLTLDEYVLNDDPRVERLCEADPVDQVKIIGGYAVPFSSEELELKDRR